MRAFVALFATLFVTFASAQNAPFPPSPKVVVAVNPITNKVYVANESANTVTVLDNAANTTTTIPVGSRPQFIAVNPVTNRIFVNNGGEATLTIIDGATDTNLTPTPLAIGSQGPMAVNTETNIVYIVRMSSVATDEVTFFNASNNTWYTIATQSFQPTAVATNPFTNTIYVAHYGTGDVRVISGAFDDNANPTSFSIGSWTKPFAVAANTSTNKVYVITEDSRGPIGIIDGDTRIATFPLPTTGHAVTPKALAVNPVTNRIYAAFAGEVIVIDGNTNAYTYVPVDTGTGPASIGINYSTNTIYVSNGSGTLTAIDGSSNATMAISIPAGVLSLGVNPVTNKVTVAGSTTSTVDGVPAAASTVQPTTTITPLSGNSGGAAGSISMGASNGVANPLPVRGVYYQLDSRLGAWQKATGSGNGPYTAAYSGLATGSHTIYAFAVEGHVAPTDTGPQSNPLVGSIVSYAFTVGSVATATVSLASSQNPSAAGQSITFTASVVGGGTTPTGTIAFTDGTAAITGCGAVAMTSGSASCTTSALAASSHTISATYSGDGNYGGASASLTQTVSKLTPTVSLGSSVNPSSAGQSVTFTASLSGTGGAPTGSVAFKDGTMAISGCTSVTVASGSAACTTSSLGVASHSITAEYSGNATYVAAVSSALSQTVQDAPPTVSTNVALAANGGSATASSSGGENFPAAALIDGERAGSRWGSGGGWRDNTPNTYPDWVEIAFSGAKTIDHVVVYSLQDNFSNPVEPTDATTFANYGVTGFSVETWNGSAWVLAATVSGNNLVKRTVTFSAVSTTKIRVQVTGTPSNYSRVIEIEAWTVGSAPPPSVNVALAANGGSASASSSGGANFPASALVNGERAGVSWGNGGGWRDNTANAYPDWVEIAFAGTQTIDRVVLYSLQDNTTSPVEPTDTTTFANYGVTGFTVEAWNGSAWVLVATVTGNNLVKRAATFSPVATPKIRVQVTGTPSNYSRVIEIEAWTVGSTTPQKTNFALAGNGGSATASSTGGANFPVAALIDGERAGANWGSGGGWRDNTPNAYPDWVEIAFTGTRNIDTVTVYSMQDNSTSPTEPTDSMTFTSYGVTGFTVEAWNGSAWTLVATVTGNNLVKRSATFAPVATTKVRVQITGTASNYSRVMEIEAWGT